MAAARSAGKKTTSKKSADADKKYLCPYCLKEKKKTETSIEEPKNAHTRSIMDKTTAMLVHLMEDCDVSEIRRAANNGINLQASLEDGQTVLMIAVKNNQDEKIIPFLREYGIDINAVDDRGQTALMLAATFNQSPEVIRALLDNGADKTIKDKIGNTAFDYVKMNVYLTNSDIPALLSVTE